MNFVKCLQLGKECEKTFMRYLVDYPGMISIELAQWKFKDWDIKMKTKDKEITYEVKSDRKSEDTWNCCIECMYKGEPSWVYASKADYIVYYTWKKWWMQERWKLLILLNNIEKEVVSGGDGNRSELYLIKLELLPQLFEEIPELPILQQKMDGE